MCYKYFYRVGLSIGISTLQYLEDFFIFLQALSSRIGFNAPRPSFPLLTSPWTRAGAERDKREVGTILGFGWYARAFNIGILAGGMVVRKYTEGATCWYVYCSSGRNHILSAVCIAAPKSRCPCCFAGHPRASVYGRCTLHFTVLVWREDRLEHPSPFVLRTPWTMDSCELSSVLILFVAPQKGQVAGGQKTKLASDFISLSFYYTRQRELFNCSGMVGLTFCHPFKKYTNIQRIIQHA